MLRAKCAPVENHEATERAAMTGKLTSIEMQLAGLAGRVQRLEAQPLPVKVATHSETEPSLDEQIERLTRLVKERKLGAATPEVMQLMRLHAQKRGQTG